MILKRTLAVSLLLAMSVAIPAAVQTTEVQTLPVDGVVVVGPKAIFVTRCHPSNSWIQKWGTYKFERFVSKHGTVILSYVNGCRET